MDDKDVAELLKGVDIKSIIKKSIRGSELVKQVAVNEAYVAEPKHYPQVSEYVSQKTKTAHEELYKELIEAMNRNSAELDTADRGDANSKHSQFRSLKLDESFNVNGVWLHELYFANCFDPNSQVFMDGKPYMTLSKEFGTFDDWQRDFIACSLACGNGWAVCGYNMFLRKYVNTMISNHSQDVMVGLYPLIVLDVNEHAYFRDHLGDKKSYVVSSMRMINWNVVEERFIKAENIANAIK